METWFGDLCLKYELYRIKVWAVSVTMGCVWFKCGLCMLQLGAVTVKNYGMRRSERLPLNPSLPFKWSVRVRSFGIIMNAYAYTLTVSGVKVRVNQSLWSYC